MSTLKPEVVNIPYDTPHHRQIVEAIKQRYQMSREYMSRRYTAWSEQEERFRAYVNLSTNDSLRKNLRKQGKPQYTTIDVPFSYAMLLTAHTYWTSVFLSRNPVFQYAGRRGQTQEAEQAVEALMDYQLSAGRMLVPMYLWFMDAGKYGLGVLGSSWFEEYNVVTKITEVPVSYFGIAVAGKTKKVKQTVMIPTYQGNRVFNVRPQDYFPDPRVPISRVQDGEFNGRMVEVGWNKILRRQQDGWYYNVETLQTKLVAQRNELRDRGSSQLELPAGMDTLYYKNSLPDANSDKSSKKDKAFIELFEIAIEIVPRDWGLGNSTYPEKWVFTLGNMEVLLNVMPAGNFHGKFETHVLEYEIEGYALNKRSMLEMVDPLNETLTWLFNSHMYNVRKVMNDQMFVDPSRIVMKDLTDPNAGRIVRLKPEAYGTDPKMTYSQMQVTDVTQNHLRDAAIVTELMQKILGVNENVMGQAPRGGRTTATQVRTDSTFSVNRLKTNCEYMSAMGFQPLAQILLANTQQRYDGEEEFRIAGSMASGLQKIRVTPDLIAGEFDFSGVDGTLPIDRFAQANLWKEIMVAGRQMPELQGQVDWVKVLEMVAELGGIKDFDQFRLQVNVVPDGSMANGVQAGNVVPLTGGPGGAGGRTIGSSGSAVGGAGTGPSIPGTASVAGVGRTG